LLPEYHQNVRYTFDVNGRTYQGLDGVAALGKRPEEMTVGEQVIVYYLPDDPSMSCIGDPEYATTPLRSKLIGAFWVASVASLLSLISSKSSYLRKNT